MNFATEDQDPKEQTVLSLVHRDNGTVEIMARLSRGIGLYRIGVFEYGKLNLCSLDVGILASIGIESVNLGFDKTQVSVGQHQAQYPD